MTTHAEHDHPNTKAARAACRKGAAPHEPSAKARKAQGDHPAGKAKKQPPAPKITKAVNTSLPHEFDEDTERAGFCYVCRLTKRARVHTDGPSDLSARFTF